jgi:hypothetical protein
MVKNTRPKLKRRDLYVISGQDIPKLMKSFGVDGVLVASYDYKTRYNAVMINFYYGSEKNPQNI